MSDAPILPEERYARQIRFTPIGEAGQRLLRDSCALIIGLGALGSSIAEQLARAGVGTLRLADRDFVEPSNLQRQSLYAEEDARLALPKAAAAASRLRSINRDVKVEPFVTDVTAGNLDALIAGADLVMDGTDNAGTRLLLSDACYRWNVPLLYGGIAGSEGVTASFLPGRTICLRCLMGSEEQGESEANCEIVGVIGPAVQWVASLQVAEALKWLTGHRDRMRGSWLSADIWNFRLKELALPSGRPDCPFCGEGPPSESEQQTSQAGSQRVDGDRTVNRLAGYSRSAEAGYPGAGADLPRRGSDAVVLCGRDSVQVTLAESLTLREAERRLSDLGCTLLTANPYLIRYSIPEGLRLALFNDNRILVQGTSDAAYALQLCHAYLGLDRN